MNKGLKALERFKQPQMMCDIDWNEKVSIIEKELKRLEKIEELCKKVVEKPIYEKFIDTHEIHKEDYTECDALYSFKHNRIELYLYDFVNYLELDKYGKTWALTEEELL